MSYNVLSHRETSSLTYCKPEILDPTTRRENLILEIDAQRADLIALQVTMRFLGSLLFIIEGTGS